MAPVCTGKFGQLRTYVGYQWRANVLRHPPFQILSDVAIQGAYRSATGKTPPLQGARFEGTATSPIILKLVLPHGALMPNGGN